MPGPSAAEDLVGREEVLSPSRRPRRPGAGRSAGDGAGERGGGHRQDLSGPGGHGRRGREGRTDQLGHLHRLDGAPGHWPWTQILNGLVRAIGADQARQLAGGDAGLLATIVPSLGEASHGEATDKARLLLLDATARFVDALAAERPLVVVLDDLQWADESSLALFDFVARAPHRSGVGLIGAYRHDELKASARGRFSALVSHSHHVHIGGLDADAVHELVERAGGRPVDRSVTKAIHRRTGGHPLFVREVTLLTPDGNVERIPAGTR